MIQRLKKSDDRGAALLLALIIVVVFAIGLSALLTFSDTSIRSTVALRDQASVNYDADGAAQVAINQLRKDNFNGASGGCTTAATLVLPNFYPATATAPAASAAVKCTPDALNATSGGGSTSNTSPGSALLALATVASGETGISANVLAGAIKIRGGVFSNSTIDAPGGLSNVWTPPASNPSGKTYNIARGACTGTITVNPAYGTTTCNYGTTADTRGDDPGTLPGAPASYSAPTASTAAGTIGTCAGGRTYQTVTPGLFTSASALNGLTGCSQNIVVFTPGTYYFNFTGSGTHLWDAPAINIIGGTPTIPLTTTPSADDMVTACIGPGDTGSTTSSGVLFVFGGDSQLGVNTSSGNGSQMTLCASNSTGPPIAIYGLKTAVTGVNTVPAQSGCVTAIPPSTPNCSMITTGNSPKSTLTIRGTTYVPKAKISITLNNASRKVFYWGLITRSIAFSGTGSADVSSALVDVPDVAASPTPGPTIMYLDVYVCPGSSTCSATGTIRLRAKALVSAVAPRTVSVLSWSVQR